MIKLARQLIEQAGVMDRAEVRQSNILDYRPEEKFDITAAVGVFDYSQDVRTYLRHIRKMTGSRFLATFPRFWTWRMPIRNIRLGMLGCPVYFYTAKEVRTLLIEEGFTCTRLDTVGAIFCVLAVPNGGG
jgi:hypothetical protein